LQFIIINFLRYLLNKSVTIAKWFFKILMVISFAVTLKVGGKISIFSFIAT